MVSEFNAWPSGVSQTNVRPTGQPPNVPKPCVRIPAHTSHVPVTNHSMVSTGIQGCPAIGSGRVMAPFHPKVELGWGRVVRFQPPFTEYKPFGSVVCPFIPLVIHGDRASGVDNQSANRAVVETASPV